MTDEEEFVHDVEDMLKQAVPVLDLGLNRHGVELLGIVASLAASFLLSRHGDPEVQQAAGEALDAMIDTIESTNHTQCVFDFATEMTLRSTELLEMLDRESGDGV